MLEIGSAYGDCLQAAHVRCKEAKYLGIDISEEAVLESRIRYPHIVFEKVDVVKNPEKLKELATGTTVIAIDINGNRAKASVIAVLASDSTDPIHFVFLVSSRTLMEVHRPPYIRGRCTPSVSSQVGCKLPLFMLTCAHSDVS